MVKSSYSINTQAVWHSAHSPYQIQRHANEHLDPMVVTRCLVIGRIVCEVWVMNLVGSLQYLNVSKIFRHCRLLTNPPSWCQREPATLQGSNVGHFVCSGLLSKVSDECLFLLVPRSSPPCVSSFTLHLWMHSLTKWLANTAARGAMSCTISFDS